MTTGLCMQHYSRIFICCKFKQNYLRTQATNDTNGEWDIAIDGSVLHRLLPKVPALETKSNITQ
jgi:hypothetical protein